LTFADEAEGIDLMRFAVADAVVVMPAVMAVAKDRCWVPAVSTLVDFFFDASAMILNPHCMDVVPRWRNEYDSFVF
jgi:hypothetical protein